MYRSSVIFVSVLPSVLWHWLGNRNGSSL